MRLKHGTEWKIPQTIQARNAGVWKNPKSVWTKVNGVWKQLVPHNCVVLYNSATLPAGAVICNGTNGTPNLLDRWIDVGTDYSPLTVGGEPTHSGSSHGTTIIGSDSVGTSLRQQPIGIYSASGTLESNISHSHTGNVSHSHSGVGDHRPRSTAVVPTMGLDYLAQNAIIFNTTALAAGAWVSLFAYYILMASYVQAELYSITHDHGLSGDDDVSTYTFGTVYKTQTSSTWAYSHKHTVNHRQGGPNNPRHATYYPHYNNTTNNIYLNDLPSNSLMLFTSDVLPEGWTRISNTQRLLSGTGIGSSSNNITHTHDTTTASDWTQTFTQLSSKYRSTSGTNFTNYVLYSHTHTFNEGGGHSTSVSLLPPWVTLVLAQKS